VTAAAGRLQTVRFYSQTRYPFRNAAAAILHVPLLADLHVADPGPAEPVSDQDSSSHAMFYAAFATSRFRTLYRRFLAGEVLPLFGADLCVQKVPTFRVARPGGQAVSRWHTDAEFAHQLETVNFWVPLTRAQGTATVWTESEPGKGDYAPVDLDPGSYLEFSATRLRHGNKPNTTGRTRVSFDFRVIPLADYADTGSVTVSAGRALRLGDYYMLLRADGTFGED
jgi:hypothetical protein